MISCYTFSLGLGSGSEMTLSQRNGRDFQQLYVDRFNYLSFARSSPDGSQIAFIKIPDLQTPFTVGELWVMDSDGSSPRKLADADAGHGYAANWSPDGKWIAFVKRENAEDQGANQSAELVNQQYLPGKCSKWRSEADHLAHERARRNAALVARWEHSGLQHSPGW